MDKIPNINGKWNAKIELFIMKKIPKKPNFDEIELDEFTINLRQQFKNNEPSKFVYANIINSKFRPNDGYLPGIIIKENDKWKLILTDYDDNGVFKMNIDSEEEVKGYYHESGYGTKNLNQIPTVGEFIANKISKIPDELIPKKNIDYKEFHNSLRKKSLENNNINSKSIKYNTWVYNINSFKDYRIDNKLGYDIIFAGPIFDESFKNIIGFLNSYNKYIVVNGNSDCKVEVTYYFYHEDNIISFSIPFPDLPDSEKIKYKGYYNLEDKDNFITFEGEYQGNLTNAQFLLGQIELKEIGNGGIYKRDLKLNSKRDPSDISFEPYDIKPKINGQANGKRYFTLP